MELKQIEKVRHSGLRCEQCAIRNLVLLAEFDEDYFELIHRPIKEFEIEVGDTLYNQGDASEAVFALRSGLVKLVSYLAERSIRVVRIIKAGDVVGI